jgi:hypothetical protein
MCVVRMVLESSNKQIQYCCIVTIVIAALESMAAILTQMNLGAFNVCQVKSNKTFSLGYLPTTSSQV